VATPSIAYAGSDYQTPLVTGTDYLVPNGSGASLTGLNASSLASGTIPDGRFPSTLPALSGANLTALNASNLASGTLPTARFPAFTGDITSSAGSLATTLASTIAGPHTFTGNLTAPLLDKGGVEYVVENYGAVGDGSTDDTVAIQAAITAAGSRGKIRFRSKQYKIGAPGGVPQAVGLTLGDGSLAAQSTTNAISLLGAGTGHDTVEGGNPIGGTELLWYGSAGGVMLDVKGPISGVQIEGIYFNCRPTVSAGAATAMRVTHAFNSTFRKLSARQFSGAAYIITGYSNPSGVATGANNNLWEQVRTTNGDGDGAKGIQIGATSRGTTPFLGVSKNLFLNCEFLVGDDSDQRGIEIRYADFITFLNTVATAGKALQITPATDSAYFPGSVVFDHCALFGGTIVTPTPQTVTITIATPGVLTLAAHGMANDTPITLATTGALPTGLVAGTTYYVRNALTNTFELSATAGGASITTSGSQSGVQTASIVWSPSEKVFLNGYATESGVAPTNTGFSGFDTTGQFFGNLSFRDAVGIGLATPDPNRQLHIKGTGIAGVELETTVPGSQKWLIYNGAGAAGDFGIYDDTSGGDRLVISAATGDVTIGSLLKLGSGPTTISDSVGKILSSALNTVAVAQGGTGVTSSTGSGSVVLSTSPTLVTPNIGAATGTSLDLAGNMTLSGTGRRFIADMSNATPANRFGFQSPSGSSVLSIIPGPGNNNAAVRAFSTDDPGQASFAGLRTDNIVVYLEASRNGAGAFLPILFMTNGAESMRLDIAGNLKIGGNAARGTTEGTKHLDIFDGVAPVGTLANGVSFYSASGEARVMDAAGNSTLLSPHDHQTNEWIFYSKNTVTGKVLKIDMERMMKALDVKLGGGFIHEYMEAVS
jgi:hypothetical protein